MRLEVLGSLRATVPVGPDGTAPSAPNLGGPKQRLVLALLLCEPNTVVPLDRLVDGLWGDDPPETARHTLQGYISELRKEIGPVIERSGAGYAIAVDRESLDSLDFEARVSVARTALGSDPERAVDDLRSALSLWRGPAFQDFPDQHVLEVERARLDELRLAAVEDLVRARLALGQHTDVVVELDRLTNEHPYREELRAMHMLALYRSGRQADALRAYRRTRDALRDELGIEPSPRLRRLEEQILLQDPDLEHPGPTAHGEEATTPFVPNPYVGLRAFHEEDHARFFGREDLVARLLARVQGDRTLTALVGPSGSGKSSVVRAGLVPRLRHELPTAAVAIMQPGTRPFAELRAALHGVLDGVGGALDEADRELPVTDDALADATTRALPSGSTLVLLIDQFEELFTVVEPAEARRFLATILRFADDPARRTHVILTLRADHYDRPLAEPTFGPTFADNVVNVVPLDAEQLESAAVRPARQADVTIEPQLLARLISEVATQPNALPLFQYVLTELFDERSGSTLDPATYDRIGGVRAAIARRADSLYARLDPEGQEAARQLFLRVTTVSHDVVGRRRVPGSELVTLDVDVVAMNGVIDAYSRHRLLVLDRDPVTNAPTIEVAHEALLEEWQRLRDWIADHHDDLARHASFVIALGEWERSGRDPGYLLTGTRLADHERWATTTRLALTESERAYVDESVAARERARADTQERVIEEARLRRRSRRQLALLFVIVALLVGVIAFPLIRRTTARDQVVLAIDSPRDYSSFQELLVRGLDAGRERYGVDAVLVEPPFTADIQATLREAADADPALMIAGSITSRHTLAIAPDYPDTTFVAIDRIPDPLPENVAGVRFAVEQGAFLVGAAAALESRTGRVGYIGANGQPFIEVFRAGFEHGARTADPDVEIVAWLLDHPRRGEPGFGGYDSPVLAKHLAGEMYGEGVDVIFTAAGQSGFGVIEAASELSTPGRHLWAIGVDSDQFLEVDVPQRDHVLTSALKRFDAGVREVIGLHAEGVLTAPSVVELTLAEGGVGYSTSGNHLADSTIAALEELAAAIVAGNLEVDPVPERVAEAPAAPAPVAATVRIDDVGCSYDGPAQFEVGTIHQIAFVNETSRLAGVGVWDIADGTTMDQLPSGTTVDLADTARRGDNFEVAPDDESAFPVVLDTPGDWLVTCGPGRPHPAAIVQARTS